MVEFPSSSLDKPVGTAGESAARTEKISGFRLFDAQIKWIILA
jgi:hypothetical protein